MYALLMEINVVMLFQVAHTFLVYQFIYAQNTINNKNNINNE